MEQTGFVKDLQQRLEIFESSRQTSYVRAPAESSQSRDLSAQSGANLPLCQRFGRDYIPAYDRDIGSFHLDENLGSLSPFRCHVEQGVGGFVNQISFAEVKKFMGITFFRGANWLQGEISAIYIVDKVRRLGGDLQQFEIDVSLYVNMVEAGASPRLMLTESTFTEREGHWCVNVLNEDGVISITEFLHDINDGVLRKPLVSWLPPVAAMVPLSSSFLAGPENRESRIIVTSQKDDLLVESKKQILKLMTIMCKDNGDLLSMAAASFTHTSVNLEKPPPSLVIRIQQLMSPNHTSDNTIPVISQPNLLWFCLTGRFSADLEPPTQAAGSSIPVRTTVCLKDFAYGLDGHTRTSAGLASLLEGFAGTVTRLNGVEPSWLPPVNRCGRLLRDVSNAKGTLGCLSIEYLRSYVARCFSKLGLCMEDFAANKSAEAWSAFEDKVEKIFALTPASLTEDVADFNRLFLYKRGLERAEKESESAKKKLMTPVIVNPVANRNKGGGGRGNNNNNSSRFPAGGLGGGAQQGGRAFVPAPPAVLPTGQVAGSHQRVCVGHLQHLVDPTVYAPCSRKQLCFFKHDTALSDVDRKSVVESAKKVINDKGRLATLMVYLTDMNLKFKGE